MGTSQSQEKISCFQQGYIKEPRVEHSYFGNHFLLINRNQKQMVILKQIVFQSSAQYRQYQAQYSKIERKPFNVIYPKLIVKNGGIQTCTHLYQVNAYFDVIGKNLAQIIKTQGCFNQSKAWFLLNQISKSLEILSQSNRPHWAICPQNIYQNAYQNYFIYDTFFVIGFDPQSFLMNKLQNNAIMTDKMKMILQKGLTVSPAEGFEEDCYCMGFVILFALTGIHPNTLPKDSLQRTQTVNNILLQQKRGAFSAEIVQIILMLTERETLRRMDNYQLRRLLKDKESQIIRNQEHQFQKSRKKSQTTPRQSPQIKNNASRHTSLPIYNAHKQIMSNYNEVVQPMHYQYSNRVMPQVSIARTPMLVPYDTFSQYTIKQAQINPQPSRAHISHFVDYPSDRSNTLTRINSNDRLIPKR